MAVDRGGLRYPIKVENQFSGAITDFRNQVEAARRTWRSLKNEFAGTRAVARSAARGVREAAAATRSSRDAAQRHARGLLQEARALKTKTAAAREATVAQRQLLKSSAFATNVRQIQQETAAVRRLADAYNRLAAAKRAAGRVSGLSATPVPGTTTRTGTSGAGGAGLIAVDEGRINRISFTFRRLFGILAAFAAARTGVNLFISLLRETITFSGRIEQARLGIASIISAVADIRDATGETVTGTERLVVAQAEAAKQVKQLRVEALRTAATFDQIVDAFQVAIAPGLQAGLNLEQVRQLSVRISQAAAAIGVPQNQLSEEIRSLLRGNINPRNTRIATALGITNEDIRNAREAGRLFEFLSEKFSAFAEAGDAALGNFEVLVSNVKDSILAVLETGGVEFFEQVKGLLSDILNIVRDVSDETAVVLSPESVRLASALTNGIAGFVREMRTLLQTGNQQGLLAIASALGSAFEVAGAIIRGVVEGILDGIADISRVVGFIVDLLDKIGILNRGTLNTMSQMVRFITRIVVIVTAIHVGIKLINVAIGVTRILLVAINGLVRVMNGRLAVTGTLVSFIHRRFLALSVALILIGTILFELFGGFKSIERIAGGLVGKGEDLLDTYLKMPAAIGEQREGLEANAKLMEDIRKEAEGAAQALTKSRATLGLSGSAEDIVGTSLQVQEKFIEQLTDLREELERIESRRLGLSMTVDRGIQDFQRQGFNVRDQFDLQDLQRLIDLEKKQLQLRNQLTDLDRAFSERTGTQSFINFLEVGIEDIADVTQDWLASLVSGHEVSNDNAAVADQIRSTIASTVRELTRTANEYDRVLANLLGVDELTDQQKRDVQQILGNVNTLSEQAAVLNQLSSQRADILTDILRLEREIAKIQALRITAVAEQGTFEAGIATRRAGLEAQNLANQLAVSRSLNSHLRERVDLEGRLAELTLERQIAQEQGARNLLALQQQLATFQAIEDPPEEVTAAIAALEAQITAEKKKQNAEQAVFNQQIETLARDLEDIQRRIADPIGEGFRQGIRAFAAEALDSFSNIMDLTKSGFEALADFLSQSIADVFDPSSNTTFRERLGKFLQFVGQSIINMLVRVALAKAALGLLGGFAEGGLVGAAVGFHRGGQVGHDKARGYASGGQTRHGRRPVGLHPSDTIPIWTAPGEWVIRAASVARYGAAVLDKINRGLVDPMALSALAGVSKAAAVAPATGPGFAEGGGVPRNVPTMPQSDRGSTPIFPAIPATESTMDRLARGGRAALRRHMKSLFPEIVSERPTR